MAEAELVAVAGCRDRLGVAEGYRDRRAVVACHGHPEVLCHVRPLDHGHRSAVRLHSIVPAAEPRARQVRQRGPAWEAGRDLQFSQEPDPALVLDQD